MAQALIGEITAASFQSLSADIVADRCAGSSAENFVEMSHRKAGRVGDAPHRQRWITQMADDVEACACEMLCRRAAVATDRAVVETRAHGKAEVIDRTFRCRRHQDRTDRMREPLE